MVSKDQENWLTLAKLIFSQGHTSLTVCDLCFDLHLCCVIMDGRLKCTECTHHSRHCVPAFMNSLNCVHEKLQSDLEAAMKDHEGQVKTLHLQTEFLWALDAHIMRLWKTFQQNKSRLIAFANCLVAELDDDNDSTENDNSQTLSQFLDQMSIDAWQSVSFPPQTAATSLCSSWGFLWVSKLTLRYHILFTWQDSELSH